MSPGRPRRRGRSRRPGGGTRSLPGTTSPNPCRAGRHSNNETPAGTAPAQRPERLYEPLRAAAPLRARAPLAAELVLDLGVCHVEVEAVASEERVGELCLAFGVGAEDTPASDRKPACDAEAVDPVCLDGILLESVVEQDCDPSEAALAQDAAEKGWLDIRLVPDECAGARPAERHRGRRRRGRLRRGGAWRRRRRRGWGCRGRRGRRRRRRRSRRGRLVGAPDAPHRDHGDEKDERGDPEHRKRRSAHRVRPAAPLSTRPSTTGNPRRSTGRPTVAVVPARARRAPWS